VAINLTMKKKVIILTNNEIRHKYFRTRFSSSKNIDVLKSFCEGRNDNGVLKQYTYDWPDLSDIEEIHFKERFNTEYDFFSDILNLMPDLSNPAFIEKGEINLEENVKEIIEINPDLIITYGCSIIKPPLISAFPNRIINVHLGLSPYYFGAGTNFHPLVNNEPQFVGYTFMYMDNGIDTGEIIHQKRATVNVFDNPHQIGNRLIKEMTADFIKLVEKFYMVKRFMPLNLPKGKTYKKKDATKESIIKLYKNFAHGLCENYLRNKTRLIQEFPIIEQSFMKDSL